MAIYRNIQMTFWTDPKVDEDFTPEDKYFYLYLLTNPHTNLLGCYEIGVNQMSRETGYERMTIEKLLSRFESIHNVLMYSNSTKEIIINNWNKYNWINSPKFISALKKQLETVKNKDFYEILRNKIYGIDTVSNKVGYPMDTTVTDIYISNNDINTEQDNKDIEIIKNIVSYLNKVCGTRYRHNTNSTKSHIRARLNEGFTENDFYEVIDKKYAQWGNDPKMEEFLRPQTLFGTKFESYLNQKTATAKQEFNINDWS